MSLRARLLLAAMAVLSAASPALAQRQLKDIPDPDPELERKSFTVADGFEVTLWASDPLLAKPLEINFDPDGRMWVCCSETYPQILPGQKPDDKVLILEDTTGAGRADRVTVFARGLLIPTGIEPGDGGAYVANSAELVHFKAGPDGKAVSRRTVLSGFGTEDTHHILHTLRWGYDGQLYMNQSVYIHSHIETPHGPRRLGGGGIWRFRPETERLEVYLRGLWNTWGHHYDRYGQSFATDGAGFQGPVYVVPGAMYDPTVGAVRVLPGLNPGSPKYCGLEIVSGRHLPDAWQGNLVTNDFRAHRVCRFVLSEDGSGFASRQMEDLIKTNHVGFRPIDVKMGPDGAIYIADWYSPIIQHGEVDFRDPRRDRVHGRIWRVTAKGRPTLPVRKLSAAPVAELLEALKAPEEHTRRQAKRVLKERGQAAADSVLPALAGWVAKLDAADPEADHHRLEALWAYQSLDVAEPKLLAGLLSAKDGRIRAAAARVLGYWADRVPDSAALLAKAAGDEHPRVRLEAVRAAAMAAGETGSPAFAEAAMAAVDKSLDKCLDYAAWMAARDTEALWLADAQAGKPVFGGDAKRLCYALESLASPAAAAEMLKLLKAGKVPAERRGAAATLVASQGGPAESAAALELALGDSLPVPERAALLDAVAKAARQKNQRPAVDPAKLSAIIDSPDATLSSAAARAAGALRLEVLREKLAGTAASASAGDPLRRAAAEGLALLGGPASRDALLKLSAAPQPAAVRTAAVAGLSGLDAKAAASAAAALLAEAPAGTDPAEVVAAFVQKKDGAAALAAAINASQAKPSPDTAAAALRAVRSSGRKEPALESALSTLAAAKAKVKRPKALPPDQLAAFIADVKAKGDPARGEDVFRRAAQACLKCHAVAGSGGNVGPSLESIGASAQIDYLVESILDPDKSIKEGFHSLAVRTDDGRIITGLKVRETEKELVVRDAEGRETAIATDSIEAKKQAGSLMPAGLADDLTDAEFADLVRFLSELGKVGPYSVSKERLVRTWQILSADEAAAARMADGGPEALLKDGAAGVAWASAYTKVSGLLPTADLPAVRPMGRPAATVLRARLDVSAGGQVRLAVDDATGLRAWLDGKEVALSNAMTVDLPSAAGVHTLTVGLFGQRRTAGLRLAIEDVPGSPARVQIVNGK
jgi:putative heme-binding domain-containing protein